MRSSDMLTWTINLKHFLLEEVLLHMPPQDHSRRVSRSVQSRSSHLGILSLSVPVLGCPWDHVWVTVELGEVREKNVHL